MNIEFFETYGNKKTGLKVLKIYLINNYFVFIKYTEPLISVFSIIHLQTDNSLSL